MWDALYDICARERVTIHTLCTRISERKDANTSLTAAIRVFALAYFRAAATEEGHMRASHGNGNPFTQTPFDNGRAAGRARGQSCAGTPADRLCWFMSRFARR